MLLSHAVDINIQRQMRFDLTFSRRICFVLACLPLECCLCVSIDVNLFSRSNQPINKALSAGQRGQQCPSFIICGLVSGYRRNRFCLRFTHAARPIENKTAKHGTFQQYRTLRSDRNR
eukprot:g80026.t1